MGFDYLNQKTWSEITREERLFCSHLFHTLQEKQRMKQFLNFLKEKNSPAKNIPLTSLNTINVEDKWEVGFEVCFYRDLLLEFDISVKKNDMNIEDKDKLIKRTFDLCLFNKENMIIIEAKCFSNLDSKQYGDFKRDKNFIEKIYDYIASKNDEKIRSPQIQFVFLASSYYYKSESFMKLNGIGRSMVDDFTKQVPNAPDKFISWKQIEECITINNFHEPMLSKADEIYKLCRDQKK